MIKHLGDSPFAIIPNKIIKDKRLSANSFRLYSYLASKPENWTPNNKDIMKNIGIGSKNTLAKCWRELEETGWIDRFYAHGKDGKFTGEIVVILYSDCDDRDKYAHVVDEIKELIKANPELAINRLKSLQSLKKTDFPKSGTHNNKDYTNNKEYTNSSRYTNINLNKEYSLEKEKKEKKYKKKEKKEKEVNSVRSASERVLINSGDFNNRENNGQEVNNNTEASNNNKPEQSNITDLIEPKVTSVKLKNKYTPEFDEIWAYYNKEKPNKGSKKKAFEKYKKKPFSQIPMILQKRIIDEYRGDARDTRYMKHFSTFLNQEEYENYAPDIAEVRGRDGNFVRGYLFEHEFYYFSPNLKEWRKITILPSDIERLKKAGAIRFID